MGERGYCRGCGQRVSVDVPPDGHTRAVPIPSSSGPAWAGALEPMLCGPVDCDPEDEEEEPARG